MDIYTATPGSSDVKRGPDGLLSGWFDVMGRADFLPAEFEINEFLPRHAGRCEPVNQSIDPHGGFVRVEFREVRHAHAAV